MGIRDGRIVAIGEIDDPARETIEAAGRVVAPGFIDVHTHYDAQAFWDGNPVPSRHASREEMITLARHVRDFEGTTLEFLPGVGWGEEVANYMADLSVAELTLPTGHRPRSRESRALRAANHITRQRTRVLALVHHDDAIHDHGVVTLGVDEPAFGSGREVGENPVLARFETLEIFDDLI